jgi:hypothetical protein
LWGELLHDARNILNDTVLLLLVLAALLAAATRMRLLMSVTKRWHSYRTLTI